MRVNSFQLIKFCGTWTDPAAETKSIGYRPTLSCLCFCRAILTTLSWHDKSWPLIWTTPSGQLHRDTKRPSSYRDFAKTHAIPDTPPLSGQAHGNSLNRRAVIGNVLRIFGLQRDTEIIFSPW